MPNGNWTVGELGRRIQELEKHYDERFDDLKEEVKWTKRFLIGALGMAILASLVNGAIGVFSPPV